MAIETLAPLTRLQMTAPGLAPRAEASTSPAGGFARVLEQVVGGAASADAKAAQAIEDLASGAAEDVHTAVLAVAQADLSFRLALELRNRLQEAYQQVTQIQV